MTELGNMSLNNTSAGGLNETEVDHSGADAKNSFIIAASFILLISILGMIGNSLVFWYLGFRIKRTKYTVYILNLAVADLIYLIFISIMMCIILILFSDEGPKLDDSGKVVFGLEIFLDFGNNADMFLLTAISVERCLSVFYPIYYHCNKPKLQSVLVCVSLWGLSALMSLVDNLGCPPELFNMVANRCTAVQTFVSVITFLVTIPIMIVSSLILLIRIRNTSKKGHPSKLFIVIVASVIIFLISVAPVRLLWLLLYLKLLPSSLVSGIFFFACYICITINSSANPFIYFLVGRHNMKGVREYFERALNKIFREEEEEEAGEGVTRTHEEGDTTDFNTS